LSLLLTLRRLSFDRRPVASLSVTLLAFHPAPGVCRGVIPPSLCSSLNRSPNFWAIRMNTLSISSQRPFQRLHPLSLLAQLISRNATNCLRVTSGTATWALYFEQGQLCYAAYAIDPFERLDRHLRRLSRELPALASAVRVQVRLLFETSHADDFTANHDYQAIRWLVEQNYLDLNQATRLIEDLAKEVLEPFLLVQEGSYEILDAHQITDYPNLCQLDLRPIVEECQQRLRSRQPAQPSPPVPLRPDANSRSIQRLVNLARPGGSEATAYPPRAMAGDRNSAPLTNSPPNHYTIACVDDSPTILESINAFLDDASFSVSMISDPVKALMQIVRIKPDLILLDVGMPNLDGYELCSLLRRHPSFKSTPIIMVTGLTGFIDRAKARLVGASGYLTKPFTQSELLKTIFKHLT
jgi:two-component system, chemotaxis family, response regulator PixG